MEGKGGAFGNSLQSLGGCDNTATTRQKLPRMLRPRAGGDSERTIHEGMRRVQWDWKANQPAKRMTQEQNEKRNAEIHRVVSVLPIEVLALGYVRYEKLRLLNASQYAELNRRNLAGEGHFDDLVDQLEEPK